MLAALLLLCSSFCGASAGTTGAIVGRVIDATTKLPLVGARVNAVSPSQSAATTTDAAGAYRFISLAPDTYVLSVEQPQYDPASLAGVTVLADQTQTLPLALTKSLATIGRVRTRASSDLIKPGTTSDVYSVNAAGAEAAQALGAPAASIPRTARSPRCPESTSSRANRVGTRP